MTKTNIPHFDYPFRFGPKAHAVTVEQDSIEDIESCLQTVLLTEIGQRLELPTFGTASKLFALQPLDLDAIYNELYDQEPRAIMVLSQRPDPLDYLTALVQIEVKNQNPRIGEK